MKTSFLGKFKIICLSLSTFVSTNNAMIIQDELENNHAEIKTKSLKITDLPAELIDNIFQFSPMEDYQSLRNIHPEFFYNKDEKVGKVLKILSGFSRIYDHELLMFNEHNDLSDLELSNTHSLYKFTEKDYETLLSKYEDFYKKRKNIPFLVKKIASILDGIDGKKIEEDQLKIYQKYPKMLIQTFLKDEFDKINKSSSLWTELKNLRKRCTLYGHHDLIQENFTSQEALLMQITSSLNYLTKSYISALLGEIFIEKVRPMDYLSYPEVFHKRGGKEFLESAIFFNYLAGSALYNLLSTYKFRYNPLVFCISIPLFFITFCINFLMLSSIFIPDRQ